MEEKSLEHTDYNIVKNIIEGNGDFSLLFIRYRRLVHLEASKLSWDYQEMEDISQEVFMRVFKSLSLYNSQYRISTWIAAITRNFCRIRLRRNKSFLLEELHVLENSSEAQQYCTTPEETAIAQETARYVRMAVKELPEIYRAPIVLFYFKGLAYNEIASKLGAPLSIVKNRIYRAKILLKSKLTDSFEF